MKKKNAFKKAVKQLFHVLLFSCLCPLVMAAIPQNAGVSDAQTLAPNDSEQVLNLSSNDMGLNGPLTVGLQYSHSLDLLVMARFTQALGTNNAMSFGLEGAKHQYRGSLTWGHALTVHQRFKLTAEYLSQDMDFDFDSGKVDEWIGQPAYGFTYEYLFSHKFLNDIHFNTFYSHANSRTLDPVTYTKDGLLYRNWRHIAGGSDEAMSFGVDLLPTQMTRLGLQMDYDNLRYDMRYEKNSNTSGLGGTITLDQIVARRLKFSLLASDRKPYQEYQAGIKWLADNAPGNVLEIGLSGTHIAGSHGIDNDNRVDLDLTYSWDSDTMGDFTYYGSFGEDNSQQALRSWTAAPAVHMEQVLAVRDEKVQQVVTSKQSFVAAQAISIPVVPGNVRVELSKYIANSAFDDHWQVSGLPSELHYENGVISGKLTKQDVGKHFSVALVPASNDGAKPCALNLQVVPQGDVPAPMSDNCPPDVSYSPGETITPLQYAGHYNPESSPKGLFYDDIWEFNSLSLTVTGLKDGDFDSGLKANYAPNDESGILTIQGTVSSVPHVYHVKIYATNLFGESTKTQDFTITVGKQIPLPSVNVSKQPTYTEGDRVTNDEIATASAGNGSVFDDASAITVTAEDTQGHYYPLSDFNLSDEIKLSADHTSATIDLQDKDATGAAHPEKSAQNYVIQATNHDGQQAKNTFLLTVNTAPSPTVTISKSNPTYTEGDMPSETIATAYAGKGELFDTSSANTIQVKAVDGSNNKYDLSHFNLQAVVQYSDDQHATITLKNIDGKKVVASQDSPQRYEIKATNKASKVATDDFTLTVHPFAGTAYLQCPSTLHKDSDPTWVVGESEDTRGDNYVFSTHLQSELPDSALKELELFNARYEEGTMYCVYTSKSIGHIMVQAGGVPKHQAENIQFTHPDQSKYMCKGQVDYCQLQYDE